MKVLVTGAAGELGRAVVARLRASGHEVVGASRKRRESPGVEWRVADLGSDAAPDELVRDVEAVIHCATSAFRRPQAVDAQGTERLLVAARRAGVGHFLYPSIVGIDVVPYAYYRHKLAAEQAIEASGLPYSVLRATKFHQFLDMFVGAAARLPVMPLPTDFLDQPVDVGEVAARLVAQLQAGPGGRLPDLAGPEVLSYRQLAEAWLAARGLKRAILHLPVPGAAARGFRAGGTTSERATRGELTWNDWLQRRYPSPSAQRA